ncbi:hypothetical protein Xenpb_02707 [Xenorhabdus sp. PB62.4]|nr:hypothetical protein [Xenorhabdus sp. PB62.4]
MDTFPNRFQCATSGWIGNTVIHLLKPLEPLLLSNLLRPQDKNLETLQKILGDLGVALNINHQCHITCDMYTNFILDGDNVKYYLYKNSRSLKGRASIVVYLRTFGNGYRQ